jgi:RNA polymerase sigma-70 factor (ECF subfamily)
VITLHNFGPKPRAPRLDRAVANNDRLVDLLGTEDSIADANGRRDAFPAVRDVDDIVQESYLRIWKTRATHPIQSAKAFLFTVARHVALNFLQRQRSSPVIAVGDLSPLPVCEDSPGGYEALSRNEKRQLLVAALATLPPRCREITVLRKLQGIPQRDVAAALGLSERTVEEQVARGVRRCEDYLRRRGVNSYYDR